jgi:diaminopimelate epimerase
MLPFRKMHGLGNDFVVLDARGGPIDLPADRIRLIGDRHRGVGFDQLLVMEPANGADADIFMRIFNTDGTEAEACGNGTRCVADLVMRETGGVTCAIQTRRGRLGATRDGDLVSVDMGAAQLDWAEIPLAEAMDTVCLPIEAPGLDAPTAVGMGNPHCVFLVSDAEAVDVAGLGARFETHPLFPARTNVEFASVNPDGSLRLRVWERGVGITLACGSGTCAAAVAAHRRGIVDARSTPLDVVVDGGRLSIRWRAEDDHVIMTGPTATVFTGDLAI